jgi:hypothetical protein
MDAYTYGYSASFAEDIYDPLREILKKNPKAKQGKIRRLYVEAILDDRDLAQSFVEAFFSNVLAMVTREREHRKEKQRRGKASERRAERKRTAGKKIARVMFDFEMPNKKKLRDCTFEEVGKFGARFTKLAAMGKPDEIVGEVLTRAQVKKAVLG